MAPHGTTDECLLRRAIALAVRHVRLHHGGPFGAIVAREGKVIAAGWNQVTSAHDPTAHAEIVAIRKGARRLGTHELIGCTLYSSCEPCPMCLAAAYWARLDRIVFAATRADAARAGFDDERLYGELPLPIAERSLPTSHLDLESAATPFEVWATLLNRKPY